MNNTVDSAEPLVSVIIPTYKRGKVIRETIEAVLAQTYPRLEIVLVNDGSPDNTHELVQPYLDRLVYIRQENQGLAAARNIGMLRATGEYIAWLDDDDLWNPDKTALQVAYMQQHPEVVLTATDFSAFDADGFYEASHIGTYYSVIGRTPGGLSGLFPTRDVLHTRGIPHLPPGVPESIPIYGGYAYPKLVEGNCMHPPTAIFRRSAIAKAGLLDAVYRRDTDYEYLLRVSRLGNVALLDRPLIRYRYSADQLSNSKHTADMALSRLLVLESVRARDPEIAATSDFQKRLGYSYLAAADALAETRRLPALGHLLRSLGSGYLRGQTWRTLAKLVLPRTLIDGVRKLRASE
jgi:glycosyltransferase involved in cell wall biosynthesis